MSYPQLQMLIAGEWTNGTSGVTENVICPADGTVLGELPHASKEDLDDALNSSLEGFNKWRGETPLNRQSILEKAAKILEREFDKNSENLTREMGKPLAEAKIEMQVAIDLLRWYGEEGKRVYGRIIPSRIPNMEHEARKVPVGPVLAFVAWNFPATNVMSKVAGALAAGCSITIKPSEETPATAVALGECFMEAGLPSGVLNIVFGIPDKISRYLLESPIPKAVTFTGSVEVGKHLQSLSSNTLKKCTLELGGHAPVIICDDVDVDKVLAKIAPWKFRNSGQVCISPSRFFVQDEIYKKFVDGFVNIARQIKLGNGLENSTDMGPLIFEKQLRKMEILVEDAKSKGSSINLGGKKIGNKGYFYEPTVLTNLSSKSRVLNEEPFGPLVPILPFKNIEEATEKSNSLSVGLASYVFTENQKNAHFLGSNLNVGIVCVNHTIVSVPEAPFGGVDESGYGKENGIEGLESFLKTKYISEIPSI